MMKSWILGVLRDFWIYFKTGHGQYLTFALGLINFVVLQYRLTISYLPGVHGLVGSLFNFSIIFLVTYVPLATIIGIFEWKKGVIKRTPKLNPYIQDELDSEILLRAAMRAHIMGKDEMAQYLLKKSSGILERWKK